MIFYEKLKKLKCRNCEITKLAILPIIIWAIYIYLKLADLVFEAGSRLGSILAG
jgi:hypothetical protein